MKQPKGNYEEKEIWLTSILILILFQPPLSGANVIYFVSPCNKPKDGEGLVSVFHHAGNHEATDNKNKKKQYTSQMLGTHFECKRRHNSLIPGSLRIVPIC